MEEETLKGIVAKLEDHERRITLLEGMPGKVKSGVKKLSVKEFILEKKPSDYVQTTLVIGYFLEHFEGMDKFNVKDLAEGFMLAKEQLPKNVNDTVNTNIAKGYMMPAKERKDKLKAWFLTNSGEKFVEEILPEGK